MSRTSRCLLLIDRDRRTQELFAEALEGLGARVVVVVDPEEVAPHLREQRFDAVFVDANFPGLDPRALARLLSSSANRATPAIRLVTPGSAPAPAERMRQVAKPAAPADIKPLLESLLDEKSPGAREEPRLAIRTTVACAQGARCFRGMSINLGPTGLLAEISMPLERGQEFDVHFPLPGLSEALRAHVRVTRMERPGVVGLTFENMSRNDHQRLEAFLAKHLKPALLPGLPDSLGGQGPRTLGR